MNAETSKDQRIVIVGAGISGATLARILAEAGYAVLVVERHSQPGGHCHTYRDPRTGIMVHAHGPHIFHSDSHRVWDFVERFAAFMPYEHNVLAVTGGRTYPLPINLETVSLFFNRNFTEAQAKAFIAKQARKYEQPPANFEEKGRSTIGDALYEAFFHGYTRKQWGLEPALLPASVFSRLPVRFNHNRSYYHHKRIAIPIDGYTELCRHMLKHPDIEVQYGRQLAASEADRFKHVIYTGPLDSWFENRLGRLLYRTLDFEVIDHAGTHQETTQVNFCDLSVDWTRIVEHKHFEPWHEFDSTICHLERSRDCGPNDTPYYPVRLAAGENLFRRYRAEAEKQTGVSFVGRLATYRYIDMDVAIHEAMNAADTIANHLRDDRKLPAFFD